MTDEKRVVIDETGEVSRPKTKEEIEQENGKLEETLKPEKQELDPEVLKKLMKKKDEKMKATAKRDRSLYFGVVGLGQAGNRVGEIFYNHGYETIIFNSATQDFEYIELPSNKKVYLPLGLGGSGKELSNGLECVEQNADLILEKLNATFSDEQEMLILAISGAGGTGSGGAESMIGLISTLEKPIGVVYILPGESEDSLAKSNSLQTLNKLAKMASADVITSLFVVDNSRAELLFPNKNRADFWKATNEAIVKPLHLFNHLSSMPTKYDSLDPTDCVRVLTGGDCVIYGEIQVEDFEEETALAEAIINQLEDSMLASDFDLTEAKIGGFIVVGNPKCVERLPVSNISYALHMTSEKTDHAQILSGVYEMEEIPEEDGILIYTLFSGLGLPKNRVETLKVQAKAFSEIESRKEGKRAERMAVEFGEDETHNQSKEIHRKIKQNKSAFNKITRQTNVRNNIKDRRKR